MFPKILISLFLISKTISILKSSNIELAINCGGPSYTSSNGIKYIKDTYFIGGQSSDAGLNLEIKNTKDQIVYQTERWSEQDLIYNIPIKNQGTYVLILKFSEIYFNSIGEKVFDIKIGDDIIINDLDIFSKIGKNSAYDEFITLNIKGDNLFIQGKKIKNGFNVSEKKIKITFVKKEKDNPKINGILLVKGGLENTDYEEFKNRLDNIERSKVDREKNSRTFHRISKSIDFEDFEDDFVDDGKTYRSSNGFFSTSSITLMLIIFSKIGKNSAYDEFITLNIKGDNLFIQGKKIKNGYNISEKNIKITFVKKEKDNPKINGILLVKGGLENTDYEEFKSRLENIEKSKIDREKNSRSFHRISKSIDFEDFEDDFVDDGKSYRSSNGFFSASSITLMLIIFAVIYFVFFTGNSKRRY